MALLLSTHPAAKPPTVGSPVAVRACSAVSRAEVEAALGVPLGAGREEASGAMSTCEYAGRRGQVTVTVQRLERAPDMPAEIASLKAEIPEAMVREGAGLGARAFYLDIPGAGTQLHVIRGDSLHLMVSVLGFGEPAQVAAAAEKLVRRALGRL